MEKTQITVIGAGIVGLACAAALSEESDSIFIVEQNEAFGMETSSRNSEVIHCGLYYPTDTLKHRLCIEGNALIYKICEKNSIEFKNTEKLIVAPSIDDTDDLEALFENGLRNGVSGLTVITGDEAVALEPAVKCVRAIRSATTGIVDSHNLMRYFLHKAQHAGAEPVFNTEVKYIEKKSAGGYVITVRESSGEDFIFESEIIINSAGFDSDIIAGVAGMDIEKADYTIHYCKGNYFRVSNPSVLGLTRLVYPAVKKDSKSLGIHTALDLTGGIRLGPDVEYLEDRIKDYNVDENRLDAFYESVSSFIPALKKESLYPDTAGIRAKLQGPAENVKDFVIKEEKDAGLPGFINLIGIDSPGLTASPAIAQMVKGLVFS